MFGIFRKKNTFKNVIIKLHLAFGIEIRNPYFLYRAEFRLRKNNIAHSRAAITDVLALAQLLLLRLQLVMDEYSCTLYMSTEKRKLRLI